jgi:hypothetical protein
MSGDKKTLYERLGGYDAIVSLTLLVLQWRRRVTL